METSLKYRRSERRFPPKRGKVKLRFFDTLITKVVSVATKASGESQEDNGGQQQWSTSPNSAGHAATLVGYNSDAEVSES
ncbi:hypothetical protein Q3G72_017889 [Acer saccharum]|nr:hypothetical protein Q3G72_017889 [Acer saccharum]